MNIRTVQILLIAIGILLLLAFATSRRAAAESLAPFAGYWSGITNAEIVPGKREQVKCNATNRATPDGMHFAIQCGNATDAVRIRAQIRASGSSLSGSWEEVRRYNTGGTFSGTVSGNTIRGKLASPNFNASLVIARSGNGLAVSLNPSDQKVSFSVSLRR